MMLAKTDVNTGRQIEFDYLKGLFIPFILLIHAFQMLGGAASLVPAYKITYIAATMTGSAIFLFVLGLGTTYSRRTTQQLVKDGIRLIVLEFVWNVLSLAAPMIIGQALRSFIGAAADWDTTWARIPMMLQYINIFFMAGICYLLLALLRRLKLPTWGYFALALLFILVNPFLYLNGKTTGNAVLDYVLGTFAGGRSGVSLCTLAHIPYALLGVGFGRILRRTTDKRKLYKTIAPPLLSVVIVYFIYSLSINTGLDTFYTYSGSGYVYPGTLRALANCSCVLLAAGSLYALKDRIGSIKPLHSALLHLSRWNTPYYAVHPFFYGLFTSLALYAPYSAAACLLLTPINWALCYLTLRLWNVYKSRRNSGC